MFCAIFLNSFLIFGAFSSSLFHTFHLFNPVRLLIFCEKLRPLRLLDPVHLIILGKNPALFA